MERMNAGPAALPRLSLVLGGASSGKSAFAEALASATGQARVYLATAQPFDAEMQEKIAQHRQQRGPNWRTIEAPTEVAPPIEDLEAGEILLFDCATVWLSNLLLAGRDLETEETALGLALAKTRAPVVIVSNEVGSGIVPENALARKFRTAQGQLNRRLAAEAGLVVQVVAGLARPLKGQLPPGLA